MGILAKTCDISKYVASTDLDDDFLSKIAGRIRQHAFREIVKDSVRERSVGWVDLYNMLDNQFDDMNFLKEPFVTLSMRIDTRAVPASVIKRCCLEAEYKIKKEEGITTLPKLRVKEIKEAVRDELLRNTVPTTKIHDVIWNYQKGYVFFTSTSPKICDEFCDLFYNTFEVSFSIDIPSVIGSNILIAEEFPTNVSKRFEYIDNAGAEFLTWLWYKPRNENTFKTSKGEARILFDGRVVLDNSDADDKEIVTCVGDSQNMDEIKTAIENDKDITQAKMLLQSDDGEWLFTLDAAHFDFKALKTPKVQVEDDDFDGAFYEKIALVSDAVNMLDDIYKVFVLEWGAQQRGEKV